MIRQPGLTLIADALSRAKRTLAQQVVVVLGDCALIAALDVSDDRWWPAALLVVFHLLASSAAAYVHRSAIDPSSLPSLAPPDTPTFREAPLEPPVPTE